MSDFEREERYIVVKRKHLDEAAESALRGVIAGLDLETIECVVVEEDWPNYEATWEAVRQVAEGTYDPDEIATLRQQLQQSEARCAELEKQAQQLIISGTGPLADNANQYLSALILRKQAEAVESAWHGYCRESIEEDCKVLYEFDMAKAVKDFRKQADELEHPDGRP